MLVIALLIGLPAGGEIYKNIAKPATKEEMRPVVEYLKKKLEPDDRIYVYYGAKPSFKYYYRDSYENVTLGESHRDDITKYVPEINEILEDNLRIWLIFSHYWPVKDERGFLLSYLGKKGALLDSFQATGASAYLYKTHPLRGAASEYLHLAFPEDFSAIFSSCLVLANPRKTGCLGAEFLTER